MALSYTQSTFATDSSYVLKEKKGEIEEKTQFNQSSIYKMKCIQDKQSLLELRNDWNQLVQSVEGSNPFMLWEWLYTWWDVYADQNKELHILALYNDDNQLVSIAPFYIKKHFKFIKRLSFIGEGEKASDEVVTHYPDVIVSNENKEKAITQITEYLVESLEKNKLFDLASFELLKADSTIFRISKSLSDSVKINKKQSGNQFTIPLPSDEDEYIAGLSKSVRKQFRLKNNRLEKLGTIEIKTEVNELSGLETLEKLVRARWESIMPTSLYDSALFVSFHNKLAQNFSGQGVMDIRTMTVDGIAIVSAYNFNYKNTSYAYLSGFKSEDDNRLSPMFVFDLLELKRMIREGLHSYDLLVSESEVNYKNKFSCEVSPSYSLVWFSNSASSKLVQEFYKVKPLLSKIKHSLHSIKKS